MNVSTAVNLFIKAVLREQRLSFEIKTSSDTINEKIKESEQEMYSTEKKTHYHYR